MSSISSMGSRAGLLFLWFFLNANETKELLEKRRNKKKKKKQNIESNPNEQEVLLFCSLY